MQRTKNKTKYSIADWDHYLSLKHVCDEIQSAILLRHWIRTIFE